MKSSEGKQTTAGRFKDWNTAFSLFALLKTAHANQQTVSTLWLDVLSGDPSIKHQESQKKIVRLARQHQLATAQIDDMCELLELQDSSRLRPVPIQSVFVRGNPWSMSSLFAANTMVICDQHATSVAITMLVKYLSGSRSYRVSTRKRGAELVVTLMPSKRKSFRVDDFAFVRDSEKLSTIPLLPRFDYYILLYALELLDHQGITINLRNKQGTVAMYIIFPVSAQLNVFGKN